MGITNIDDHIVDLIEILDRAQFAIDRLEGVQRVRDAFFSNGISSPTVMETTINNFLSGLTILVGTEIGSLATSISTDLEIWAPEIKSSMMANPTAWRSTDVDVDDGASGSTLTINQDASLAIFAVFDIGDSVKITNAEDPNHNARYEVSAVTGQVLTFSTTMLGEDNTNDETMIITLLKR